MGYGFIHKPEEIKCLILYCLSLLPFSVGDSDLHELTSVDGGFDFFEYSQALQELIDFKHIACVETSSGRALALSPSGMELNETMAKHLPPSVRDKADILAVSIISKIKRERSLHTSHKINESDSTYKVHLAVLDRGQEQFSLDVTLFSERQCYAVENTFKKKAEKIYGTVLDILAGKETSEE